MNSDRELERGRVQQERIESTLAATPGMGVGLGVFGDGASPNVVLLSRAPPRIRNLVNSPETVNSGTFDWQHRVHRGVRFPPESRTFPGSMLLPANGTGSRAHTNERIHPYSCKMHSVSTDLGLSFNERVIETRSTFSRHHSLSSRFHSRSTRFLLFAASLCYRSIDPLLL